MPASARHWTRDQVLALPDDGQRYELVDGELLVSPGPRPLHQRGVLELFRRLDPYVQAHALGSVYLAPADLDFRSGQLLQPDLFVVPLAEGHAPLRWDEFGVPLLVAEVSSPATARFDRITKRRLYQRAGVGTYWIVDLDARLVEVWTPASDHPVIADDVLRWQPPAAPEPLVVKLEEYFES